MGGLSNVTGALCIFSVLGPYTALAASGHGSILDPNRLFTIVTTVNLLSAPLNDLGQAMPVIFAAYASMKRIQSFLLLEDQKGILATDSDNTTLEKQPLDDSLASVIMSNASFGWTTEGTPFLRDINMKLEGGQLHVCVGPVASVSSLVGRWLIILLTSVGKITSPPIHTRRDLYEGWGLYTPLRSHCLRSPGCLHHAWDYPTEYHVWSIL